MGNGLNEENAVFISHQGPRKMGIEDQILGIDVSKIPGPA